LKHGNHIWVLLLCIGCAQVRSLPGGEKDITPPIALAAFPPHLTTNFQGNSVEIVFDEYIQLNSIQQELVISPPLKKFPDIKVRQRSVVVKFNDELLPNTTYQLNFGDGVTDVNENNKAEDLIYVFSTGNAIDSLEAVGKVQNVETGVPAEKFKVLLFENDTAAFSPKTNPLYFTKTKSDGSFLLSYLKAGFYQLIALNDENSNYHWDEGEAIALLNNPFQVPSPDSAQVILHASTPLAEMPDISGYELDSTGIVKFPLDHHFLNTTAKRLSGDSLKTQYQNDSLFVVLSGNASDRFEEVEFAFDSLIIDTIEVPFFNSALQNKVRFYSETPEKIRSSSEIKICTNRPVSLLNEKLIQVKIDSTSIGASIERTGNDFSFLLNTPIPPGKNAEITIPPGTFATDFGAGHDSLLVKTYLYRPEEMGTLVFNIEASDYSGKLLLIISDKSDHNVFRQHIDAQQEVVIKNLPPGDYTASAIEDVNMNLLYDPVNIKRRSDPEITHVFGGKIGVRSNWELKLSWKID